MSTAVVAGQRTGVVPGRESISAEFANHVVQQRVELDVLVARDAWIWGLATRVGVHEVVDDPLAEDVRVVEGIEGNADGQSGAARVLPRLVGSTAPGRVHVAAGRHEPHPHADDVLAAFGEQRRRHGRVHAAALEIHLDPHPVAVARIRVAAEAAGQTATAEASRSRATTRASASTNRSTWAPVVARPTVTRSEPFASSRSRPMASSTCEGSVSPEVQADPLETAKPSRSSATISDSPSVPGMQNEALFGSRSVG